LFRSVRKKLSTALSGSRLHGSPLSVSVFRRNCSPPPWIFPVTSNRPAVFRPFFQPCFLLNYVFTPFSPVALLREDSVFTCDGPAPPRRRSRERRSSFFLSFPSCQIDPLKARRFAGGGADFVRSSHEARASLPFPLTSPLSPFASLWRLG